MCTISQNILSLNQHRKFLLWFQWTRLPDQHWAKHCPRDREHRLHLGIGHRALPQSWPDSGIPGDAHNRRINWETGQAPCLRSADIRDQGQQLYPEDEGRAPCPHEKRNGGTVSSVDMPLVPLDSQGQRMDADSDDK